MLLFCQDLDRGIMIHQLAHTLDRLVALEGSKVASERLMKTVSLPVGFPYTRGRAANIVYEMFQFGLSLIANPCGVDTVISAPYQFAISIFK